MLANVVGLMYCVHLNGRMSVSVMLSLVMLGVSECVRVGIYVMLVLVCNDKLVVTFVRFCFLFPHWRAK